MGAAPLLVVVVGPIASGKSSVAEALGARLRTAGRPVAVLDLDDVVTSIGGFVGLRPDQFAQAQQVFGQLVGAWLSTGHDVVAHGPFLASEEEAALTHALPANVDVRRVLLTSTVEVALARVAGDPGRVLSRFPEVVVTTYERFDLLRPALPPSDWTFDSTTTSVDEIVDRLARSLVP